MEALAEPIQGEGGEITERVSEVVYTAKTPLPDGYRDAFALSLARARRRVRPDVLPDRAGLRSG